MKRKLIYKNTSASDQTDKTQSGNVLFIVLIAVAIFAALSFAVTQGMRDNSATRTLSVAELQLAAKDIISYSDTINSAVQNLLFEYSDTQISFANSSVTGYTNPNCSVAGCRVFAPTGGGVRYQEPNEVWLDTSESAEAFYQEWHVTGHVQVEDVGSDGAGTATQELLLLLPFVREDVCIELNNLLGVENPSGTPPVENDINFIDEFVGSYVAGSDIVATELHGQTAACVEGGVTPPTGVFYYYKVLNAR